MLPLIPLAALLGIGTGACVWAWYEQLTQADKETADRLAASYAQQLFGVTVDKLTDAQARTVAGRVKSHLG